MKKLLLTFGLAALTLASAHAQGTVNTANSHPLARFRFDSNCNGIYETSDRFATEADGIRVGIYWGAVGGPADTLVGEMTITGSFGLLAGLPVTFAIPGTEPDTMISLQIRAFQGAEWSSQVIQIFLGAASGTGNAIWSFTESSSRLSQPLIACPEPSTLALGGLACGFLLLRARKTFVRR